MKRRGGRGKKKHWMDTNFLRKIQKHMSFPSNGLAW